MASSPYLYKGMWLGGPDVVIGGEKQDANFRIMIDRMTDPTPSRAFDYVNFNPDMAPPPWQEGRVFYDRENHTFAIYNDKEDVTLQLGQEQYIRVVNETGNPISNGVLVYINGSTNGRPTIDLAMADTEETATVIGMTTHAFTASGDDAEGLVTTFGLVRGVDTDGVAIGTALHLSPANAGEWVTASPVAPNYAIGIGIVLAEGVTDGVILILPPPTDVTNHMVINQLWLNSKFGYTPQELTVTAAIAGTTGIDPTTALMRIQSDSLGRLPITANPQIIAGLDGQMLVLTGRSDANSIILHDGDGLRLQGEAELADSDVLTLMYHVAGDHWEEISRTFSASEKSWAFQSLQGSAGINYTGGFYEFFVGNDDFTGSVNFGTANGAYGAHFFVVLGELAVDEIELTIMGTSITDAGVRVTSDTEAITIPNASVSGFYVETSKKWIGQVSIVSTGGTPKACNYGWSKYWDNNNNDFMVVGVEATWLAGASDADPDIELLHHKATGWTYNGGIGGNIPEPPAAIASLEDTYVTEHQTINAQPGAWKRTDLFTRVSGGAGEGTIVRIRTNENRTFAFGNFMLRIRPK